MIYLDVQTTQGIMKEVAYDIHDFPYEKLISLPTCKTKKCTYFNVACAFDIESTTIKPQNESEPPFGFMYQWQLCINDLVVFGRRWEEYRTFIQKLTNTLQLNENKRLVIYIHNLAYEFQFVKDFFPIDSIFAKDKRKPLKYSSNGIEYRCSYSLSNMSLAKFCENSELCIHHKLDGEYDYSKIRTPDTVLTNEELSYCFNDVRGLCECINTLLQHDTIATIPLTNTGYVRRDYRQVMKVKEHRRIFEKTALNTSEYQLFRKAFRGGNTHASRFKADRILNEVYSYDISSSYPSSIMLDDYPIGKFTAVTLDNQMKLDYYCSNYCVILDVSFYNISLKYDVAIPYVDIAHCYERRNIKNDNGRVLSADFISMAITNIDLDIIRSTYDYEGFIVNKAEYATKGKLPFELRQKMMEYFIAKTKLKDDKKKAYEYNKSKNRLNATFGMMVTDIAHAEIEYDHIMMEWGENKPNLDDAIYQFYKSRNNFLSYQWGVFVTANARKRLQVMLDKVGLDVVYIDTDSIKFQNAEHIKEFDKMNEELKRQAERNDIPAYVDHGGKRYYLGTWDNETKKLIGGAYRRFKTLGAKKYCYEQIEPKDIPEENIKKGDITFHVTVSGMGKEKGAKQVGTIENFMIGRTYSNIGRTTSWYNDHQPHYITVDGCTFLTASNIGVLETTYTLGITNEYWELIYENGEKTK